MSKSSNLIKIPFDNKVIHIIGSFYKRKRKELKCNYSWRVEYNEIPNFDGILKGANTFEQNVELKKHLNREYKRASGNKDLIFRITKYYIYNWGGIRTNSKASLEYYAFSDARDIISNGSKGVASWSKALTARDSRKYAIFDARVAVTLNALIYKEFKLAGTYFPQLPSRNNRITDFQRKLRKSIPALSFHSSDSFYLVYLYLIHAVAVKYETSISEIEMCLFAYAEEIAFDTFR